MYNKRRTYTPTDNSGQSRDRNTLKDNKERDDGYDKKKQEHNEYMVLEVSVMKDKRYGSTHRG